MQEVSINYSLITKEPVVLSGSKRQICQTVLEHLNNATEPFNDDDTIVVVMLNSVLTTKA